MLLNENLVHPEPADVVPDVEHRRARVLSAYRALRFSMEVAGYELQLDIRQSLIGMAENLDNLILMIYGAKRLLDSCCPGCPIFGIR